MTLSIVDDFYLTIDRTFTRDSDTFLFFSTSVPSATLDLYYLFMYSRNRVLILTYITSESSLIEPIVKQKHDCYNVKFRLLAKRTEKNFNLEISRSPSLVRDDDYNSNSYVNIIPG